MEASIDEALSKIDGAATLSGTCVGNKDTYVSTILTDRDNIAASSFTRCGLFAVCCNCTITPSTISSLMPSKSISRLIFPSSFPSSNSSASGEGGGVFSYFNMPLFRVSRFDGGGDMGAGETEPCDRFIFFDGGKSMGDSVVTEGEGDGKLVLFELFAKAAAAAALFAARSACETGR